MSNLSRKKPQKNLQKMPLQVTTEFKYRVGLVPHMLTYDNDEETEIFNPVKSIKFYDGAVRWRCIINGQEVELFNEGENWWTMR